MRSRPSGQPAPHGERSSKGLFAFWAAKWTTVMQPTKSQPGTRAPDVFQRDQIARAGWRAMPPKDLELQRLSPTAAEQSDAMAPESRREEVRDHSFSFARTSTIHQRAGVEEMKHRALYRRVVSEYRDAHGEKYARWIARQIALIGTPF